MDSPIKSKPLTPQKEEIIAVARDLLAQYGYDGLSIRDLAQRSGLATATIYHHFRDKEDILLHVLEHDAVAIHSRGMAIATSDQDAAAKLRALIHNHVKLLFENRLTAMTTMRRIKTMENAMPWFIERILPRVLEPITLVIEQGIEQGAFRPIDTKLATFSLLGMLHANFTFCLVLEAQTMPDALIDEIADIFVHGIVKQNS